MGTTTTVGGAPPRSACWRSISWKIVLYPSMTHRGTDSYPGQDVSETTRQFGPASAAARATASS